MKLEVGDTALIAVAALLFAAGIVYFIFIRKSDKALSELGTGSTSLIHSFQGTPGPSPPPPVTDIRAMRRLPPQV